MTVHLGRVVDGKYRLDAVLGAGGMATVYRATHTNGHGVAIKILHPELALRADLRDRFLREGYIANAVPHEGAVTILDDGVLEEGAPFLVIELLEGETVEARWERAHRHLELTEVIDLIDRLLAILEAAHPRGVVHRDIKPANLFITRDGTLKLLDFGIARMLDAEGGSQTATGAIPGSPAFMAPEQALGFASEIDARTDLFAVGSTMFLLLSGRPIHVARTAAQLHVFACSNAAPPLRTVAPDVPEAIARFVDRLLAFSKEERPSSATAARAELAEARATPLRRYARGHRHWPWMAVGGLALSVGAFDLSRRLVARAPASSNEAVTVPSGAVTDPRSVRPPANEVAPPSESVASTIVPVSPAPSASVVPRAKASGGAMLGRPSRASAAGTTDAGTAVHRDPCEPAYFLDPATGTRRVKPGC